MPTLDAEQALTERLALMDRYALVGRAWRRVCWGCFPLIGVLSLGLIAAMSRPAWLPYYVEVDRCGGDVRVVGPAPQTYTLPELAVKQTVSRFVEALRTIPTDQELLKLQWRRASHQVTREGRTLLVQYEASFHPLLQQEPVAVHVLSVLPQTESTFSVRWEEQRYSAKLELQHTTTYRGLFTVQKHLPVTEDERQDAPLGIFFHQWSWSKE
jgi:type IV secretion system protein VirB5